MFEKHRGLAATLLTAWILSWGSHLQASGHGGGGGHMGGGGGHFGGGGGHFSGGHFGGGGGHFSGGHFGGGGFSGGHMGGFSGGHISAPSHNFGGGHISAPSHNFGGSHFGGGQNFGGHTGHIGGGQTVHTPSFMQRHGGGGSLGGSQHITHSGSLGQAQHNGGRSGGGHSGHLGNGGNAGLSGGSFMSKHGAAAHHVGGAGNGGTANLGGNGRQHSGNNSGSFLGQHSGNGHHAGGSGNGGVANLGSKGNANNGGSFLGQHGGKGPHTGGSGNGGVANLGSKGNSNHGGLTNLGHLGQKGHGGGSAVGANGGPSLVSGNGHHVNANHFWTNAINSGRHGVSTLNHQFGRHHVGTGTGGGAAFRHTGNNVLGGRNHVYNNYGFRHNRLFFGFGTGFWPYYAWNYRPFWNSGYWGGGWGWGRPGIGFGLGFRRFFLGFNLFRPWGYSGYGWGYPGYGFGNYGYGGYGYGGYSGYGNYCYNPYCSSGYGSYYPASYGYTTYTPTIAVAGTPVASGYQLATIPVSTVAAVNPTTDATTVTTNKPGDLDDEFASKGEIEFKSGNYSKAASYWKHAVVEDPKNGVLVLLLGQALFADGKYNEAAGAVQQGLQLVEEDQWNVVVKNYRDLYTNIGDYTTQLRALEKVRKDKPEEPAYRFLLGYHYGFLGYPKNAVEELNKLLELAPQDEMAQKLVDKFQAEIDKDKKSNPAPTAPAKP